jgi:formylglycine-generating enzyme required for sulfatase activity
VWEWVWDWYDGYPKEEVADPTGPRLGAQRLNRGGAWIDDPRFLRVADRSRNDPGTRLIILGFRVARTR